MKAEQRLIFLFISLTTIVHSQAFDYCKISNCNHTMCIYPKSGAGVTCKKPLGSGLSTSQKNEIVNLHNAFRQKVASGKETRGSPGPQPAAKSMPNLTWDNELETIAQRWADQCTFDHDLCAASSKYSYVGQNIVLFGTVDNVQMKDMVQMWTDEVEYFNKNQVKKYDFNGGVGGEIGHYSQVVWAATKAIGCGASKYNDGNSNNFLLVCNYGPGGNVDGESVYTPA